MWQKIRYVLYHKNIEENVIIHRILGMPVVFTSNYKKSVFVFLLFSIPEIILLFCIPDIKTRYVLITSFSLLFFSFFSTGWMFSIFYFLTGIMLIIDYHTMKLYKESFQSFAQQMLSVVFDTNAGEILSYIKIFSKTEIFMIVFLLLSSFFFIFIRKKMKLKFLVFLIMLFGIFCGYGHVFIKEIKKFKELAFSEAFLEHKNNTFKWDATASKESPHNVIILIGESQRYDYFSQKWNNFMPQNVIFMSDAISQFGFTLWAMPQILSRKTVDDKTKFFYETSVFKLFEEAGYETYFPAATAYWG